VTCPIGIIQGARAEKMAPPLRGREAERIEAGAMPLSDRGRYASAAAMPIHAAMPAMQQSPQSKHGPRSRSRVQGQRRGGSSPMGFLRIDLIERHTPNDKLAKGLARAIG
jgi:hypothetical protein